MDYEELSDYDELADFLDSERDFLDRYGEYADPEEDPLDL